MGQRFVIWSPVQCEAILFLILQLKEKSCHFTTSNQDRSFDSNARKDNMFLK